MGAPGHQHGEILVTDRGEAVARLTPETPGNDIPYFARRVLSPSFKKFSRGDDPAPGTDSTATISEDRKDRDA